MIRLHARAVLIAAPETAFVYEVKFTFLEPQCVRLCLFFSFVDEIAVSEMEFLAIANRKSLHEVAKPSYQSRNIPAS